MAQSETRLPFPSSITLHHHRLTARYRNDSVQCAKFALIIVPLTLIRRRFSVVTEAAHLCSGQLPHGPENGQFRALIRPFLQT